MFIIVQSCINIEHENLSNQAFKALFPVFGSGILFVHFLTMKNRLGYFRKLPIELIFWCLGLVGLWYMDPLADHTSLCPLHNLGLEWCPGCGLGRSISFLMKGELVASWNQHPLGGFALGVILYRIFEIIKLKKTRYNYG